MSSITFVFKICLFVLAVIDVSSENGFGYEILSAKLESLEDRLISFETTRQRNDTSIRTELIKIRKLVIEQQNMHQIYESCDNVPSKVSGVYNVRIGPQEWKRVFCDQEYDGGGWTVIQRRFDGSVNFYRGWQEYKRGFGNMDRGEFWLGLDIIHQLTYSGLNELVILLEDYDGNSTYAKLNKFEVAEEQERFKATAVGFSGTADDSISFINNQNFTTFDKDNYPYFDNCAKRFHGAWWYFTDEILEAFNCDIDDSQFANLNGKYRIDTTDGRFQGMVWSPFFGEYYALKSSKIMIRRKKRNK